MSIHQSQIRNFAIIAHIDHGKSTLADRMLELCGVVKRAEKQTLDSNPIERERGITIKLAPVRMIYKLPISNDQFSSKDSRHSGTERRSERSSGVIESHAVRNSARDSRIKYGTGSIASSSSAKATEASLQDDGSVFVLNLIDTPGHVDFSYEVSRALAACEGAILLVDASQGIQAQTMAHYREAKKLDLKLVPVINKIDLPSADIEATKLQLMETFDFEEEEILCISAKTGEGVENILKAVVERIPAPSGEEGSNFRALVFNSNFSIHQGVIAWIKVVDGKLRKGDTVHLQGTKTSAQIVEAGHFIVKDKHDENDLSVNELSTGETGYVVTGLKDPRLIQVGDTMKIKSEGQVEVLAGYNPPKPMVFASFYPTDQTEYLLLGEAMDKLKLLDSSLTYTPESSPLLGNGFRVGFLGILHAEIVQERLEREFGLSVFASQPSVVYKITGSQDHRITRSRDHKITRSQDHKTTGSRNHKITGSQEKLKEIYSPEDLPDPSLYTEIREPMLEVLVFTPDDYLNNLMKLFQKHRGHLLDTKGVGSQVQMKFSLPLAELVGDFYSAFKSVSSGFASLDYELIDWETADLVKMDILLAGDRIAALSRIVPRDRVEKFGREMVEKLKEIIPRHNFEIAVQAAVGGKILARSTVKPFRKDVTAKLYGGDQTRKDKLLKKQKKGKKKMKLMGKVNLPPDTFWTLLK